MTGKQERELLSNYREFEKALWSVLGNGADILLKKFSDNLSRNIEAEGLGMPEIIDSIRRDEPYVFVRNMSYGENVLLLYRSENFRDRIMSGFFSPLDGVEARLAALAPGNLPAHVSAMTYERLQEMYKAGSVEEKVSRLVSSIGHDGRHLRLAMDDTRLAEKGIAEEPHHKDAGVAIPCAYDIGRLSPESTYKIMERHDIVVFEESQAVFARG